MENGNNILQTKQKPKQVVNAINLLYLSLFIGIVRMLLEFSTMLAIASPVLIVSVEIIVFTFMFFLIYKTSNRRKWARFTFIALFIIGFPFSIMPLIKSIFVNPISGTLGLIQVVFQIIAIGLLLSKNSNEWYKIK
jgi:hypothetical protein